jgi:hypothetical protein
MMNNTISKYLRSRIVTVPLYRFHGSTATIDEPLPNQILSNEQYVMDEKVVVNLGLRNNAPVDVGLLMSIMFSDVQILSIEQSIKDKKDFINWGQRAKSRRYSYLVFGPKLRQFHSRYSYLVFGPKLMQIHSGYTFRLLRYSYLVFGPKLRVFGPARYYDYSETNHCNHSNHYDIESGKRLKTLRTSIFFGLETFPTALALF